MQVNQIQIVVKGRVVLELFPVDENFVDQMHPQRLEILVFVDYQQCMRQGEGLLVREVFARDFQPQHFPYLVEGQLHGFLSVVESEAVQELDDSLRGQAFEIIEHVFFDSLKQALVDEFSCREAPVNVSNLNGLQFGESVLNFGNEGEKQVREWLVDSRI